MTDWHRVDILRKKKMEVLQDTELPNELRHKIANAIETQIQQEFEITTRCKLQPDTVINMSELEFEVWE